MKTNERNYKAEVTYSTRELTAREKIKFKDTTSAIALDDVVTVDKPIELTIDTVVKISVENGAIKGDDGNDKEYDVLVFTTDTGDVYKTSSPSFETSIIDIFDELQELNDTDPVTVRIFKKPSKNFNGEFIICSLV